MAGAQRNLERCLKGATTCDPLTLSPAEAAAVTAAGKKRNLENCTSGIYSKCDLSALTAPERADVSAAEETRLNRQAK